MTANIRDRFVAYVSRAAEGRSSLPRLLLGVVIVVVSWLVGTNVVLVAGLFYVIATEQPDISMEAFVGGPLGSAAVLLSVSAIWPGLWLALHIVHRRPLASIFGSDGRLSRPDMKRGFIAALLAGAVTVAVALVFDPGTVRTDLSFAHWVALLLPYALLILLQSSAEEALFRGYLLQSLAYRFRSPLVWAVLPAGLFTVSHWYEGALLHVNLSMLGSIAAFAAAMTLLVYRTGNLGAAIGAHTGNNLIAFMLAAPAGDPSGSTALFEGRAMEDPAWTVGESLFNLCSTIFLILLMLLLLFDPRSPLRLTGPRPGGAIHDGPSS